MQRATMTPSARSNAYQKIREKGRDFIIYEGCKYRFSNPLSVKGGKNWCCTVVKCRGTLKTEMSFGKLVLTPGREHTHPKSSKSDHSLSENKSLSTSLISTSSNSSEAAKQESETGDKGNSTIPQDHSTPSITTNNIGPILLPHNYSVQSIGLTPSPTSNLSTNRILNSCTLGETPQSILPIIELKNQVNSLIEEIVRKQMEIEKLQKKSNEDENLLAELLERFKIMEAENTKTNAKIKSLEYQIALRDTCKSGPAPRSAFKDTSQKPSTTLHPTTLPEVNTFNNLSSDEGNRSEISNSTLVTVSQDKSSSSSPSSYTKPRLMIYGDSMTRDFGRILQELFPQYTVQCSTSPGGCFSFAIRNIKQETKNFTKQDIIFILAGTNDIPLLTPYLIDGELKRLHYLCKITNVVISSVPYKYHDKSLNSNIFVSNQHLLKSCHVYNFHFFECNFFLSRNMYTKHGLHFNLTGKSAFCKTLYSALSSIKLSRNGDFLMPNLVGLKTGENPAPTLILDVSCPDLLDLSGPLTDNGSLCF